MLLWFFQIKNHSCTEWKSFSVIIIFINKTGKFPTRIFFFPLWPHSVNSNLKKTFNNPFESDIKKNSKKSIKSQARNIQELKIFDVIRFNHAALAQFYFAQSAQTTPFSLSLFIFISAAPLSFYTAFPAWNEKFDPFARGNEARARSSARMVKKRILSHRK